MTKYLPGAEFADKQVLDNSPSEKLNAAVGIFSHRFPMSLTQPCLMFR